MRGNLKQHPFLVSRNQGRKDLAGIRDLHIVVGLQIGIKGSIPEDICGDGDKTTLWEVAGLNHKGKGFRRTQADQFMPLGIGGAFLTHQFERIQIFVGINEFIVHNLIFNENMLCLQAAGKGMKFGQFLLKRLGLDKVSVSMSLTLLREPVYLAEKRIMAAITFAAVDKNNHLELMRELGGYLQDDGFLELLRNHGGKAAIMDRLRKGAKLE